MMIDKFKDFVSSATETAAPMAAEILLAGLASTIVPGVISTVLAYQQKRQERMINEFMKQALERIMELENNLTNIDKTTFEEIKNKYFGFVSDYVLDEKQEEKIRYIVNGFINMAAMNEIKEDFIFLYYDTLADLRILDIMVLKRHYKGFHMGEDVLAELNLTSEQFKAINEKLARSGLLETVMDKQEKKLYDNVRNIQEYLEAVNKGKKSALKPLRTLPLISTTSSITKFGRDFLDFFNDTAVTLDE